MKHFVKITLNDNNSLDKLILAELTDHKAGDIKRLVLEAIMLKKLFGTLQFPSALNSSNPEQQLPSPPGSRFTSEEDKKINEKLKKFAL